MNVGMWPKEVGMEKQEKGGKPVVPVFTVPVVTVCLGHTQEVEYHLAPTCISTHLYKIMGIFM